MRNLTVSDRLFDEIQNQLLDELRLLDDEIETLRRGVKRIEIMNKKAMEKEQLIQALYDANTDASVSKAHDEWLAFFEAASEGDKVYMRDAMVKYSEHLLEQSRQGRRETQELLAEYESKKLETNQH